jgi:hypothetical protein
VEIFTVTAAGAVAAAAGIILAAPGNPVAAALVGIPGMVVAEGQTDAVMGKTVQAVAVAAAAAAGLLAAAEE